MSAHAEKMEPVGGPVLTTPVKILGALAVLGLVLIAYREATGLGAATAMNDGYPWGFWIAFDVVVGTALATGGYAVAILIYILNRGRYHPLIRSAILTSALGYTLGGIGVMLDLGRFWNTTKLPLFWNWNLNSVLLEVALCISLYTLVLWIELSPAFLERWREAKNERLRKVSRKALPIIERAMPWLLALGLLLPTMHQSSLGSLMILSGPKLHPLWQTPLLPLLFLLSCIGMGYAAVVIESTLSTSVFRLRDETPVLAGLSTAMLTVLGLYLVVRVVDITARGKLPLVFAGDGYSLLFLLEMLLFIAAIVMLLMKEKLTDAGHLFRTAMVVVTAGALYRFSTFLIAYRPAVGGWHYFPALTEILITLGLVSAEVVAYIFVVKRFPVLSSARAPVARMTFDVKTTEPVGMKTGV
jgi:Ni/Fe-hydrogenase subunit HybB-like protein